MSDNTSLLLLCLSASHDTAAVVVLPPGDVGVQWTPVERGMGRKGLGGGSTRHGIEIAGDQTAPTVSIACTPTHLLSPPVGPDVLSLATTADCC